MIANDFTALIGNTPILRLNNIEASLGLNVKLYAKLERFNPTGSVKDRAALFMIEQAEKQGKILNGATIIEPTSGNTGIGLAAICAVRGYKAIFTMPDTMSVERIKMLKAYGAKVVLTQGELGMAGAIRKAQEINDKTPNSIVIGQFSNPANALAHYQTTGREIWEQTNGDIDVFMAGIGTGGTFTGSAKYLKEQKQCVIAVAVEPLQSPIITKGQSGAHKIQGIGANFVPDNFDKSLCDLVLPISDQRAFECANLLAKKEGVLCGISSGAVLAGAIELANKQEYNGKSIVIILPDAGDKYLSTNLFD